MLKSQFEEKKDQISTSLAYQNYLEVKECLWQMLEDMERRGNAPSRYWQDEVAGFEYMFDASPLIIEKLRDQCHHITGLRSYQYREHHLRHARPLQKRYSLLKSLDQWDVFVPESKELGGFGFPIEGHLINIDTLKYYESLIALGLSGVIDEFRKKDRVSVVEVGGGWGGLGYQFKTLFPKSTYTIVDLPQTLLFSATYLKTLFPEAKAYVFSGNADEGKQAWLNKDQYDLMFFPHYFFPELEGTELSLIMNTVSFQEMTTEQVQGYISKAAEMSCECVYSYNRDRSPNNAELSSVRDIMKEHYSIKEIELHRMMTLEQQSSFMRPLKKLAGDVKRKLMPNDKNIQHEFHYRHVIGRLAHD